ncbi:MAG TPA: hypothetical protein VG225_14795 [Terracidiphilus sp.]|nr:hypothetical protein [Terracidiphilus sp.]
MKLRLACSGSSNPPQHSYFAGSNTAGQTVRTAAVAPARILAISDYEGLRFSRELLLREQGYYVESMNSRELLEISKVRTFDVAILCQSVDPARAVRLAEILHRYRPGIGVLRVAPVHSASHSSFDIELEGFAGPEALLQAVSELLDGCRDMAAD